jgi:hypothetical protein
MDIFIARVKFPNDPTGTIVPHQLFVGNYISNSSIEFYSISSILGKENRVYSPDGSSNPEIVLIINDDQTNNRFKVPSFIDCSKSYTIALDETVELQAFKTRNISQNLRSIITSKIEELKREGKHTNYSISLNDFICWNNVLTNKN